MAYRESHSVFFRAPKYKYKLNNGALCISNQFQWGEIWSEEVNFHYRVSYTVVNINGICGPTLPAQ